MAPQDMQDECRRIRRFSLRAIVSVTVTISFVVLTATGLMLYLSPRGRTANWTNWTLAGLSKGQWSAVHMCFAWLFVIASGLHIAYNWRVLTSYFKSRLTRAFAFRVEWVAAMVLCAIVFAGAALDMPPFDSVAAWNEQIKDRWEAQAGRPPIPHGELLTVNELAKRAGLATEAVLENLTAGGIEGASENAVFGELARRHNMSPDALYAIAAGVPENHRGGGDGQGQARSQSEGRGMGRMTIRQVCEQEGVDVPDAIAKLKAAGIDATAEASIRDVADQSGKRPTEIMNIIIK